MAVRVHNYSRLRFADFGAIDGIEFWDILDLPKYKIRPGDIQHQVLSNDRIDRLAYEYYQSSQLWWVIAWANDLEILPTDLREGEVITIPDPTYVTGPLFSEKLKV